MATAYGWSDWAGSSGSHLGHGFHATKQGERYTLSEPARRTVLNHQRHAENLKAGLHEKGKAKRQKSKVGAGASPQPELLAGPQADLFG